MDVKLWTFGTISQCTILWMSKKTSSKLLIALLTWCAFFGLGDFSSSLTCWWRSSQTLRTWANSSEQWSQKLVLMTIKRCDLEDLLGKVIACTFYMHISVQCSDHVLKEKSLNFLITPSWIWISLLWIKLKTIQYSPTASIGSLATSWPAASNHIYTGVQCISSPCHCSDSVRNP